MASAKGAKGQTLQAGEPCSVVYHLEPCFGVLRARSQGGWWIVDVSTSSGAVVSEPYPSGQIFPTPATREQYERLNALRTSKGYVPIHPDDWNGVTHEKAVEQIKHFTTARKATW